MTILLEHQTKELLNRYDIPTTAARLATDAKIASGFAMDCDGPVAMKVASPDIIHKERVDGVRLNVNPADAATVFDEIISAAATVDGARVEGVIVEPMVESGTEVIIGALCDPVFGPVVMFGAGGRKVEDQADVTFRLIPLDERDARQMIADVGGSILTKSDLSPADRIIDTLVDILLSVGGLDGLVLAEGLVELDINPLIITGKSIIAVDAHAVTSADGPWDLVALGVFDASKRTDLQNELYKALRPLFYPERIVVVGASAKPGKFGFRIIQNLVDFGFAGKLYAVHPSADHIYGCPAFPTVADLPETVDRAIIAIGAEKVLGALLECATQGVQVAQVLTAGFAEWSEDGKALETAIKKIAKKTGMRIVGPNTIGSYCGAGRITMSTPRHTPEMHGGITFISQSGTYAWDMIHRSQVQGLPLGKSLSCGNCSDVIPTDYLLFSSGDPDTEVIAMYLESDTDAGRFFRLAREVEKPLILFKGGRSFEGVRVATSHTGALASDQALWKSAARQAGALVVDSIDDLLDVLLAVVAFGAIPGHRLALFGSGGGVSVVSADVAETHNLEFSQFTDETKERLEKFGVPGTSVDNPIDIPVWGLKDNNGFIFHEMIELLAQDPNVDSIITYVEMNSVFEFSDDEAMGRTQMEAIAKSLLQTNTKGIAVSVVLRSAGDKIQDDFVRQMRPRFLGHGIPVYPTTARAIRAHARMVELEVDI
jgi:acyl-CoA synthetase (NDP forming)